MGQQLEDTLLNLIEIPSITKNEKEICDRVEKLVRTRFAETMFSLTVQRIGNSLIVAGPFRGNRQTIAFGGHLDTVPPPPSGTAVSKLNDRIIGLGASDMKGGIAVMLELLTEQILDASRFNIMYFFYDAEEGPHGQQGLIRILAESTLLQKSDFCFVLEPTGNAIELGCMGTMHALVSFKGRRAHSARPWEGENAIYKAIPFLSRLAAVKPLDVTASGFGFREVMSATVARGGDKRNVIPDEMSVNVNYRFAPSTKAEDARQRIIDLVQGEASVEFTDIAPSCPVPSSNIILDEFRQRFSLPERAKQAYTDVAVLAQNGIQAVNFGPGLGSQAHQEGEYILIEDLHNCYRILYDFLMNS